VTTQGGIAEYVNPGAHMTVTAGGPITGGQVVKLSASRTVVITAADADPAIGVALFTAANGDTNLTIATDGVWPLTAAATITYGDLLYPADPGRRRHLACHTGHVDHRDP
jgi:predicted RecA/RadA family phage recombinase